MPIVTGLKKVYKNTEQGSERRPFIPRNGWTESPVSPEGCRLVRVRTVFDSDGLARKVYRYEVEPSVVEEMKRRVESAAEKIKRTDYEAQRAHEFLKIQKYKALVADLEKRFAEKFPEKFSAGETAPSVGAE